MDNKDIYDLFKSFVEYIKQKDYIKAFTIYIKLKNTNNIYFIHDLNFYLFMLNYITDIPDYINENIKEYKFEDMIIFDNDNRHSNIKEHNVIRNLAFNKNFSRAIKYFNDKGLGKRIINSHDYLTKELLRQAADIATLRRQHMEKLVIDKKYEELLLYLNNLEEKVGLKEYDKYICFVLNAIIQIKSTNIIPAAKEVKLNNSFSAIISNNYELALKYAKEYDSKHTKKFEGINILVTLLEDIVELINKTNSKTDNNISFAELLNYLYENNMELFLNKLHIYLNNINHSELESIIVNLFKLSILKNDLSYSLALNVLLSLNSNTFTFDINEYLKSFYLAINEGNIEEAKIYLNIIEAGNKLYNLNIKIYELDKILVNVIIDDNSIIESNEKDDNEKGEKIIKRFDDKIIKIVRDKYNKLIKNNGLLVFNVKNKNIINDIINCASEYIDLEVIQINDKQIAFIYREVITNNECNCNEMFKDSINAMKEYKYTTAIKLLLKILAIDGASIKILSKLASYYYYTDNKEKALECYTVANYLSIIEKKNYDFNDIILNLQGNIDENDVDKKPYFKVKETIFTDEDYYYGIDFSSIHEKVIENDNDIYKTCIALSLNEEEINIVYLLYAREFYLRNYEKIGDAFIKKVERSDNKTDLVNNILFEIRSNKKMYLHKSSNIYIELSLKLAKNI